MNISILEKLKALLEAKVDDEYNRNYSSIDRDIFDSIVLMDPQTREVNGEIDKLGFASKSLLLRCYMNGETDFISDPDKIRDALNAYYPNISNYPKFPQFSSIADFLSFMENPDGADVEVNDIQKEDKITSIYQKYYSNISREIFDHLITLDPETNIEKGKLGTIAQQLILPDAIKGVDISNLSDDSITRACVTYYDEKAALPKEQQILNNYKSLADFVKYILQGPDSNLWTQLRNNPQVAQDVRLVGSSREYDIFEPKSHAANNAISGGREHMNWCTGWSENSHYWERYTTRDNARIFCFMHKTYNRGPENRSRNWQIQVLNSNNTIKEFLNGADSTSGFSGATREEQFKTFLLSNPDILHAIKDKEPFNSMIAVSQVLELLKAGNEPFTLTAQTAYKLQTNNQLTLLIKDLIVDMERIPAALCSDFPSLSKVEFKEGLKEIGPQAFKNCPKLTTLEFPESLVTIGEEAFSNNIGLKGSIKLPNNLTTVKTKAFYNTKCKLKIDVNRDKKITFAKSDESWVKSHVQGIIVQSDNS